MAVVFAFIAAGCTSTTVTRVVALPAEQATTDIPENEILDIGVTVFNPGYDPNDLEAQERGVFPELRRAEARFMAYTVKNTLEATSQWGAVRVVPAETDAVEVMVKGRISYSDGEEVNLDVEVFDATGRVWLKRTYKDTASKLAYRESFPKDLDPFQDMYNDIANDMLEVRRSLSTEELREIRTISELRFAASLSPDAFGDHLKQDRRGKYEIQRLPADGDPIMARMNRVREREYLFIDTLDQHYGAFHDNMTDPYDAYRRFSYEEAVTYKQLKRQARMRTILGAAAILGGIAATSKSEDNTVRTAGQVGIAGGIGVFMSGLSKGKAAKVHSEALRELGASVDSELAPMVVEIEGETLRLQGNAQDQFDEWRGLLREIYHTETGLPVDATAQGDDDAELAIEE